MTAGQKVSVSSVGVICTATAGWAFSFGLATQSLSLVMADMGWSNHLIGWNTGVYYLGIALTAVLLPAVMARAGSTCAALGMMVSGLTLVFFLATAAPILWFCLRFISGAATALSLVPLETALGASVPRHQRSRQFAIYAVALTVGGAAGIGAALPIYDSDASAPFVIGALIAVSSGLALWLRPPLLTQSAASDQDGALEIGANLLGYGSGWIQGFLEGGLIAFLGLYLLSLGMPHDDAGWMMGVSLAGVIAVQVPVGWLADRFGRTLVLLTCYVAVLLGLWVVPWCEPGIGLGAWLFLVGACSGALYPLGLALLGDRTSAASLARAYSLFMAMECLGSVLGPIFMGQGRDWFGEAAMFHVALAAVAAVLALWLAQCAFRRVGTVPPPRRTADSADADSRHAA